jgi:hypothetical protein
MLLGVALLPTVAAAAPSYTGTLAAGSNQLQGTGFWVADNGETGWFPASITYDVMQNEDGSWHYAYTLSVYRASISHMIIEVSPTFTASDLWNFTGPAGTAVVADYGPGPSNPSMPGTMRGIKFDSASGTNSTFAFDSWRPPVWGDFYARCGNVGGTQNTVWNGDGSLGFTAADVDPIGPASSTPLDLHLLVPDSFGVPEPMTAAMLLVGGVAAVTMRRGGGYGGSGQTASG